MKRGRYYIVGAGFSGQAIARDIRHNHRGEVLAFLDNDREKIGTEIESIPVLGPVHAVLRSLDKTANVLIAIPRLTRVELHELYAAIVSLGFPHISILPTASQLLTATGSLVLTREVDPADFLGRMPITLDMNKTLTYLRGKRILVTGAGGSIGSELARQLLLAEAERLFILGHGENSIYHLEKELKKLQATGIGINTQIVTIIGELQDQHYVDFLLARLNVDMIFHCAAHKHVPLMENNPIEVIKNNTFVVHFLVEAAKKHKVPHFILISTDKAVEPSNVYGVSKALSEEIVLHAHQEGRGGFALVRFGNVLGSRGSIIPLFKEQIAAGGPLTITHKDMVRYFMTIPEAVSLVLLAGGAPSKTGRYLLEMGEPVRIIDLAKQMMEFYHTSPQEMEVVFTGMRSGERLDEKLYAAHEQLEETECPRLLNISTTEGHKGPDLGKIIKTLLPICFYDESQTKVYRNRWMLRKILKESYPHLETKENEPEY